MVQSGQIKVRVAVSAIWTDGHYRKKGEVFLLPADRAKSLGRLVAPL